MSDFFRPGDQLPTENELMKQYDLSSSTVRQAVLTLVREGLLYRKAGRGTFVAQPQIGRDLLNFTGFSEEALARGFRPGTQHVEAAWQLPDAAASHALSMAEGEKVFTIQRVRTIDDEVVAIETVSMPAFLGRSVEQFDLADVSLTTLLERQLGYPMARAKQDIRATVARAKVARMLEVRTGTPLLQIDRAAYTSGDNVIYFSTSCYRADRYIYTGWIERSSSQSAANSGLQLSRAAT